MNNSLLAHLYPYIKGTQEDVATYSLQYLLSQSDKLNIAFTKMAAEKMNIELENKMQYLCQVTGESEEQERPDMVGLDSKGNETVLFEMKFYASLTQNQPNTYLKRLKKNNGKGLLFVCPMSRRTSLWAKLKELCNEITNEEISEYCIDVEGVKLSIITWNEIIEMLNKFLHQRTMPLLLIYYNWKDIVIKLIVMHLFRLQQMICPQKWQKWESVTI